MPERCTLVFPIEGKRIYLARRKSAPGLGLYNGYGGKMESLDYDNIAETAKREFEEESGAQLGNGYLTHVAHLAFFEDSHYKFDCFVYFVYEWEGQLQETEAMGSLQVFGFDDLPLEEMMLGDRLWLPRVLAGERLRARCYYGAGHKSIERFTANTLRPLDL